MGRNSKPAAAVIKHFLCRFEEVSARTSWRQEKRERTYQEHKRRRVEKSGHVKRCKHKERKDTELR